MFFRSQLAWKLTKNNSLGAKAGFIWGNVAQTLNQSIGVSSTTYELAQEDKTFYSGGYLNLGTQISIPINSRSSIILGGIAGISSNLNAETSTTITKTYSSTSEVISSDVKTSNSMKLPLDIGAGISYI